MVWGKLSIGDTQEALYIGNIAILRGHSGTYYREYGHHLSGELSAIDQESFTLTMREQAPDGTIRFKQGHVSPRTVIGYEGQGNLV